MSILTARVLRAMRVSSRLKTAPFTVPSCCSGGRIALPVTASHRRAVPSEDQVRMRVPSRLKSAPHTPPHLESSCRSGGRTSWPVMASQRRAVLSSGSVPQTRGVVL